MSTADHHVADLQSAKEAGDFNSYQQARQALLDKGEDELRNLAASAGIDGVDTMSHDHLVERLLEEPGTTEA